MILHLQSIFHPEGSIYELYAYHGNNCPPFCQLTHWNAAYTSGGKCCAVQIATSQPKWIRTGSAKCYNSQIKNIVGNWKETEHK